MRIKLLIASDDADYTDHLSGYISEHHADIIEVSVCSVPERLKELLKAQDFDAALLEAPLIVGLDLSPISLPMLLWTDGGNAAAETAELTKINKYQRISSIAAGVLEHCAKQSPDTCGPNSARARITAVWSPAGGVGKTSVALALSAKMASERKNAMYLNLEHFSSLPTYFTETGKSISAVFEMLENSECNIRMLIKGLCRHDNGGISYLCRPENYDDINILSGENVTVLVSACAGISDELIIDLPNVCDERTRRIFALADKVLLVIDQTPTARLKLSQFASQHNVFELIKDKAALVENKSSATGEQLTDAVLSLPLIQSADPQTIYKTLSRYF